jgi:hypothetical protein
MICQRPGCKAATIPMANSRPGIASITSIARISTVSTIPPMKPAAAPITIPIDSPIATDTTPISSE